MAFLKAAVLLQFCHAVYGWYFLERQDLVSDDSLETVMMRASKVCGLLLAVLLATFWNLSLKAHWKSLIQGGNRKCTSLQIISPPAAWRVWTLRSILLSGTEGCFLHEVMSAKPLLVRQQEGKSVKNKPSRTAIFCLAWGKKSALLLDWRSAEERKLVRSSWWWQRAEAGR